MPDVALVGISTAGGGIVTGGGQAFCRVNGSPIAVVGDLIAAHPPCPNDPTHCAATMASGSAVVRIGGRAACRAGDTATCGHPVTGMAGVRMA